MRQGYRNYSVFGYRPISLSILSTTGHTSQDILIDGRPYRVITLTAPNNTTTTHNFRINNVGDENLKYSIEFLAVAGGGGGGSSRGGGGGGGGVLQKPMLVKAYSEQSFITVGAGGAAQTNGSNSVVAVHDPEDPQPGRIHSITVPGGGAGGTHLGTNQNGSAGGSGGGASMNYSSSTFSGGGSTISYGTWAAYPEDYFNESVGSFYGFNGGGSGSTGDNPRNTGGGGGAGYFGTAGESNTVRPNGGSGKQLSFTGTAVTYAGGGGGARGGTDRTSAGAGYGGSGGGGQGGGDLVQSQGTDGLGGGGGGSEGTGSRGGSGVVILRYPIGPEVPKPYMTATGGIEQTYTSTVTRTNMVVNPNFEVDLFGWTGSQTDATISRITSDSYTGTACLKMETSAWYQAVGSPGNASAIYTVLPGTAYTFSVWAKTSSGSSITVAVNEFTASGGYTGAGLSSPITQLNSSWQRVSVTLTTGSTTGKVQLAVFCTMSGMHTTYLDAFLFEQASSVNEYFDGSSPSSSWTGTPNASSSIYSKSTTYRSHTFTSTGASTFQITQLGSESYGNQISYMLVGGGGSAQTGGGGAGGMVVSSGTVSVGTYNVFVGSGGPSNYAGTPSNGGATTLTGSGINKTTAYGGGLGGSNYGVSQNGNYGGSGGGAATQTTITGATVPGTVGLGESGQGNSGGLSAGYTFTGGGGGGAGSAGGAAPDSFVGGVGGAGYANTYSNGTTQYYAGGGAGSGQDYIAPSLGGGGGTNGAPSYNGMNGTANTGGGGGAGADFSGGGGSGIVVIRYRIA